MYSSLRKKLDYIPLVALLICTCYLVVVHFSDEIGILPRHIIGFIFLGITLLLFIKNHKLGVLSLGLTIVLGLFSLLSFSPAIHTIFIGKSFGDSNVTLLRFQPIFILWAIIYFTLSGRYYIGILSKDYWKNFNEN